MPTKPDRYGFMTDEETISFIRLMTGELLGIALRRDFKCLIPELAGIELKAKTMTIPDQKAG